MNKILELKKLKLELLRVTTAKAELEFKVEEKLDDILRIKEHVLLQEKREVEVKKLIDDMESK